jgi:hypothetical protein
MHKKTPRLALAQEARRRRRLPLDVGLFPPSCRVRGSGKIPRTRIIVPFSAAKTAPAGAMAAVGDRCRRTERRTCMDENAHAGATSAQFHWNDPLLLDEQLSDEERMVRDSAQRYAQERLAPRIVAAFRSESTDPEIFRRSAPCFFATAAYPSSRGRTESAIADGTKKTTRATPASRPRPGP